MNIIHPCYYCHFVHKPTVQWQDGWKQGMTGLHRMDHPIHLIIKILFHRGHPSVSIHMEHIFMSLARPIQRGLFTYSNYAPCKSLTSSQTVDPSPQISIWSHVCSFVFLSKVNSQVQCLNLVELPTGKISLPHSISGMSKKLEAVLQPFTFRWWLNILQKHL